MSETPTLSELAQEMYGRSAELDDAIEELKRHTGEWAKAERLFRVEWSKALVAADGPVAVREARATIKTEDFRERAKLAEGMKIAALEVVRSRRAQLSAAQSICNAVKAEIELAKTGPGA